MRAPLATALAALALLAAGALPGAAQAFSISSFSAEATGEGVGVVDTQAGSHPVALKLDVGLQTEGAGPYTEGDLRDLEIELPPGLVENPTAVPACSQADFLTARESPWEESRSGESCPDRTQVGVLSVSSSVGGGETRSFGLFNLAPPPGAPSEIGANPYGAPVVFVPQVRQADGDYGVTLRTRGFPQLTDVSRLELTLWGTPWSILHDAQRGNCLNEAEPSFGWAKCGIGRHLSHPATAYLTLPTACEGPLAFTARASSWQGGSASSSAATPALEGCSSLVFAPGASARLTEPRASSPSGYDFDVEADQSGFLGPALRAPSPPRSVVVALPHGVTINPSVGAGLGVCTPAGYAAESASSAPGAGCPNESKIGEFTVRTPVAAEALEGSIFLASPFDNPFDSLIAVYLVAKSPARGLLVKVAGKIEADPGSGDLTASFDRLPQLPYSSLDVHFREGERSPLATPDRCGALSTGVDFAPWRGAGSARLSLPDAIVAGADHGACPSGPAPFAPGASGGMLNSAAGRYSTFYLHLTRTDTEQEITSYSATLPPGLLGKVAGIPFCSDADIARAASRSGVAERDAPSCPAASLIGHTTSGYGVGPVLSYAPGNLYLAGPYHGSQFSVVAIDAALVGPFDLGTVVVRSAIRVDRTSGRVSIDAKGTDPIPHIIDGIPIHLRDVRASIDRPEVTVNPTSCAPFSVDSALNGAGERLGDPSDDTLAGASSPFQAFDCGSLGFKPRLALRLKGGARRGAHPSLYAIVRPRAGDANTKRAEVTLPHSLFLDQRNIQTICTRAQFAREACPKRSVYGRARAFTPLLETPLEGPVYLRSSDHPLPDVVFALKGRGFEIDLVGRIDSHKGGIRGIFEDVPDAPATKFVLRMRGGKRGILVNSARNLCKAPKRAIARFLGHNERGWAFHPAVKVKCKKKRHGRHKHHHHKGRKRK